MKDMQARFHSRALDYRKHVSKALHIQNIATGKAKHINLEHGAR